MVEGEELVELACGGAALFIRSDLGVTSSPVQVQS